MLMLAMPISPRAKPRPSTKATITEEECDSVADEDVVTILKIHKMCNKVILYRRVQYTKQRTVWVGFLRTAVSLGGSAKVGACGCGPQMWCAEAPGEDSLSR